MENAELPFTNISPHNGQHCLTLSDMPHTFMMKKLSLNSHIYFFKIKTSDLALIQLVMNQYIAGNVTLIQNSFFWSLKCSLT